MLGTSIGCAVLVVATAAIAHSLRRTQPGRTRLARRAVVVVVVVALVLAVHRLGTLQLAYLRTESSTTRDLRSGTTETTSLDDLLTFRPARVCPDEARALCDRLRLPPDTKLRVTAFRLDHGLCGLPLADTVRTTARVELELAWLRAGVDRHVTMRTTVTSTTEAFGLYACRDIRRGVDESLAAALSREIAKEVPDAPVARSHDVTSVAAGHGLVCVTLEDGSVRCLDGPGIVSRPEALVGEQVAVGDHVACAVDRDGSVACADWVGGNVLGRRVGARSALLLDAPATRA